MNRIKAKSEPNIKRGFSLVELMIVAVILGILAAIAILVSLSHSQEDKEAAVKDNLRILYQQINLYADRYNRHPAGIHSHRFTQCPCLPCRNGQRRHYF